MNDNRSIDEIVEDTDRILARGHATLVNTLRIFGIEDDDPDFTIYRATQDHQAWERCFRKVVRGRQIRSALGVAFSE